MDWYIVCLAPKKALKITTFPCYIGRSPDGQGAVKFPDPAMSRQQFVLNAQKSQLQYVNLAPDNPATVDGVIIKRNVLLSPGSHILKAGITTIGVGTDYNELCTAVQSQTVEYYMASVGGRNVGPWTEEEFVEACENGILGRDTKVWYAHDPATVYSASDLVDFGMDANVHSDDDVSERHFTTADQGAVVVPGENFKCPYCRIVADLGDVLSVSVSPSLLGDPVLGGGEQKRFLPSHFSASGLALDADGGVCTEIACPHCHMALPRALLDTEQIVMSVIGAAGAGKSVFLASSMWQCRQMLSRMFGISFMDLDPVANSWINAYEEKLFFQEDDTSYQQIAKTDLQATSISRNVILDGDSVLLPLPSFFRIQNGEKSQSHSLVVYDSAGEHFRAGADTHSSAVTLNMLDSDALFFMFDPSADPRFRALLDFGGGTAHNYAQRQDVLLAEMAARIRRHLGNMSEGKLSRPLIFGVAKADLLRRQLPLDALVYCKQSDGFYALDMCAMRDLSIATEGLLRSVVPEVVATARDIASEVYFVPISSLGHNPMNEGVRPCDIKPIWTELPVVFTLAKRGLIPFVGAEGERRKGLTDV